MNIIADVAGRKIELDKLKKKMPKEKFLYVGDLNDRGSHSKEVIQSVMDDPDSECLQSNHGAMFVDFCDGVKSYYSSDFINNGGYATLKSYGYLSPGNYLSMEHCLNWIKEQDTLKEHIEWLRTRPWYYKEEGLFVSHAARHPGMPLKDLCKDTYHSYSYSLIWNRQEPEQIKDTVQVMGHNSQWGVRWFPSFGEPWAVCIDDSMSKKFTGLHWPSLKIYQEDYID